MDKEKQIHAIVVFGDITNFGVYFHRVTNHQQELLPFVRAFDALIHEFKKKTGYFIKQLGDGFMCVVEIPENDHGRKTIDVIDHIWTIGKKINRLIKQIQTPRPDGFRLRMASGYIWRTRGEDNREDYLGYHVNLCEKMLEVYKSENYVCCQNIKENTPSRQVHSHGYRFKKLNGKPSGEGVYKIDMESLWAIIKGGSHG